MREELLYRTLVAAESINSSYAITSRISRARLAEEILGRDLDLIVVDDEKMYAALLALKTSSAEKNGNLQNALRWYYRAVNSGKTFPSLASYERKTGRLR